MDTLVKFFTFSLVQRGKCKFNERLDTENKKCVCYMGIAGETCNKPEQVCGTVSKCLNGGECVKDTCVCNGPWSGVDCATPGKCLSAKQTFCAF